VTLDEDDTMGYARLFALAQRLDLSLLARSCELGFSKSLKCDPTNHGITKMLEQVVDFVYNSIPAGNCKLCSALSAYAAKGFHADKTNAKELKDSFAISTEFSYDVALALAAAASPAAVAKPRVRIQSGIRRLEQSPW